MPARQTTPAHPAAALTDSSRPSITDRRLIGALQMLIVIILFTAAAARSRTLQGAPSPAEPSRPAGQAAMTSRMLLRQVPAKPLPHPVHLHTAILCR